LSFNERIHYFVNTCIYVKCNQSFIKVEPGMLGEVLRPGNSTSRQICYFTS